MHCYSFVTFYVYIDMRASSSLFSALVDWPAGSLAPLLLTVYLGFSFCSTWPSACVLNLDGKIRTLLRVSALALSGCTWHGQVDRWNRGVCRWRGTGSDAV